MEIIKTKLFDIHNLSMDESLVKVKEMSQSKQLDIVVTPNIDHLARLVIEDNDKTLGNIYRQASLCLCDSKILEKLLKLKGKKVVEVIPGSTLTHNLFDNIITESDSVMIVGGDEKVINKLRQNYSLLTIHHYNPPMGFIHNVNEVQLVINKIKATSPNYIFLAVGSPRQEIVAQKLKEEGTINGVALCIGASILFLVGEEKRAPLWVQKIHCEWFFRMLQDPKRLIKRYSSNFIQLPRILRIL